MNFGPDDRIAPRQMPNGPLMEFLSCPVKQEANEIEFS